MTTRLLDPSGQTGYVPGLSSDDDLDVDGFRLPSPPSRWSRVRDVLFSYRGRIFFALLSGCLLGLIIFAFKPGGDVARTSSETAPTFKPSGLLKTQSIFTVYTIPGPPILFADIQESDFNRPFTVTALFSKGNAEDMIAHMPVADEDNVFAFKKTDNDAFSLDLYRPQLAIRVKDGSEMHEAYQQGAFSGHVRSFPYRRNVATNAFTINLWPWFERLFDVVDTDNSSTALRVSGIRPFPLNLNVEVEIEQQSMRADGVLALSAAAIEFSMIMLPEKPMPTRNTDERIGYFAVPYLRLDEDNKRHQTFHTIQRRRLEKKDEKAKVSGVKKPIVYYIDKTVPAEWRLPMKRGVENWQKAFEAAGYKNAIKAVLPDDKDFPKDFDVGDARFNSISWAPSLTAIYALGPSDVDPRTGEVLRSSIVFTHGWIQAWTHKYSVLAHGKIDGFVPRPRLESRFSSHRSVTPEQFDSVPFLMHAAAGTGANLTTFLHDGITDVTMHEVGHTLGLRHNFRGSSNYAWDSLKDPNFVNKHGLSSSVMDYTALIVMADDKDQNHYFTPCVGDYDVEAIRYGYEDVSLTELDQIARNAVAQGLHFSTDEDAPNPSGSDPYSSTYDAGANPMDYHENMAALAVSSLKRIKEQAESIQLPWSDFTLQYSSILRVLASSGEYSTKFIGGYSTLRHRSNAAKSVTEPIPRDLQRRALTFIFRLVDPVNGLLGFQSLSPISELLVTLDGPMCDGLNTICMSMTAVDTISMSHNFRQRVFRSLLNYDRMQRLSDRGGLGLSEVLGNVTDLLFSSTAQIPSDAQPFVADARTSWVSLMYTVATEIPQNPMYSVGPVVLDALHAQIGRAREVALNLIRHGNEGPVAKSALIGICQMTSDYTLTTPT